jgi:hypothetical protein
MSACHDRIGGQGEVGYAPAEDYSGLVGVEYQEARKILAGKGFSPRKVACSEKNICLENDELATSIDSGRTCGKFSRQAGGRELVLCLTPLADKWVVEKIEEGRDTHN